jgi:tetratricopeptide (TPR) repeat protein
MGRLDEAMARFEAEARICTELCDFVGLGASLGNQAALEFERGAHERATRLLRDQERLCRQTGDMSGLQRCLSRQALVLQRAGRLREALALQRGAAEAQRRLGDLSALQETLGFLALTLGDFGDYDGALDLLAEREGICRRLDDRALLAEALMQRADLYEYKLRQKDLASTIREEAAGLAEGIALDAEGKIGCTSDSHAEQPPAGPVRHL